MDHFEYDEESKNFIEEIKEEIKEEIIMDNYIQIENKLGLMIILIEKLDGKKY